MKNQKKFEKFVIWLVAISMFISTTGLALSYFIYWTPNWMIQYGVIEIRLFSSDPIRLPPLITSFLIELGLIVLALFGIWFILTRLFEYVSFYETTQKSIPKSMRRESTKLLQISYFPLQGNKVVAFLNLLYGQRLKYLGLAMLGALIIFHFYTMPQSLRTINTDTKYSTKNVLAKVLGPLESFFPMKESQQTTKDATITYWKRIRDFVSNTTETNLPINIKAYNQNDLVHSSDTHPSITIFIDTRKAKKYSNGSSLIIEASRAFVMVTNSKGNEILNQLTEPTPRLLPNEFLVPEDIATMPSDDTNKLKKHVLWRLDELSEPVESSKLMIKKVDVLRHFFKNPISYNLISYSPERENFWLSPYYPYFLYSIVNFLVVLFPCLIHTTALCRFTQNIFIDSAKEIRLRDTLYDVFSNEEEDVDVAREAAYDCFRKLSDIYVQTCGYNAWFAFLVIIAAVYLSVFGWLTLSTQALFISFMSLVVCFLLVLFQLGLMHAHIKIGDALNNTDASLLDKQAAKIAQDFSKETTLHIFANQFPVSVITWIFSGIRSMMPWASNKNNEQS